MPEVFRRGLYSDRGVPIVESLTANRRLDIKFGFNADVCDCSNEKHRIFRSPVNLSSFNTCLFRYVVPIVRKDVCPHDVFL